MNEILSIKPQAVIFDWSDTIVGSLPKIHRILNKNRRIPLPHDEIHSKLLNSLNQYLPKLIGNGWEEVRNICADSYKGKAPINLSLMPYLLNVISLLHDENIPTIIVSNRSGMLLRRELQMTGLDKLFNIVVGVGDTIHCKPNPEPIYLALEESGIDVAQNPVVWLVGDSSIDMECAYNSSCIPVLLGDGNDIPNDLLEEMKSKEPPLSVVTDFEELARYIEKFE